VTLADRATIDPLMIEILARQGRIDEAIAQARVIDNRDPGNRANARLLARLHAAAGNWPKTAQIAARLVAAAEEPATDDRILLVSALIRLGRADEALPIAKAAVDADAADARTHYALGAALLAVNEPERARHAWQDALRIDPTLEAAAIGLARLDAATGDVDAARSVLEELVTNTAGNIAAVLELSDLDLRGGKRAEAVARLRDALDQNPDVEAVRLRLARALVLEGDAQAALEVLSASTGGPESHARLRLRTLLQIETGQLADPTQQLERVLERDPDDATARFLLVQAKARLGRVNGLAQDLAKALEQAPESPLAGPTVSLVLEAMPEAQAQKRIAAIANRKAPRNATIQNRLGLAATRRGDDEAALGHMRAAHAAEPDRAQHVAAFLALLLQTDAAEEARERAETWFAAHPQDVAVRLMWATALLQYGDRVGAVAQYRAVLEVSPDLPLALNNLAALTRHDAPQEALALARRAVAQAPDQPDYTDTLGTILLDVGQPHEALDVLGDAYSRFPHNPTIVYRYAAALAATGSEQHARLLLMELTGRVFPEHAEAHALLKRLGG
jgi:putative PEP-CTERM system TPR-repeat lipoprotein